MERYVRKCKQYSDYELNLVKDLGLITESQKKDLKLKQYLEIEELLGLKEPCVWREILNEYRNEYPLELHSIWKLNKEIVTEWFAILSRADPKIRTIILFGKSNSGKSLLGRALTYPLSPGFIQRDGGTNVHWLEHLHYKNVILWEEPSIHLSNINDAKLIFGGEPFVINRKNKNLIERPAGPACIITTNQEVWEYDRETLCNRCKIYQFNITVESILSKRYITEQEIIGYLCDVYDGRFN